jgi:hypothetical protein
VWSFTSTPHAGSWHPQLHLNFSLIFIDCILRMPIALNSKAPFHLANMSLLQLRKMSTEFISLLCNLARFLEISTNKSSELNILLMSDRVLTSCLCTWKRVTASRHWTLRQWTSQEEFLSVDFLEVFSCTLINIAPFVLPAWRVELVTGLQLLHLTVTTPYTHQQDRRWHSWLTHCSKVPEIRGFGSRLGHWNFSLI